MQKVDPPAQVIDAFRDVQAARADLERAQNEAQTYANRVVPEARGRAAQIMQNAEAYREQTVAEATGQTSRFTQGLRGICQGAAGHAPAHVSRNHGASAQRHRQDHSGFRSCGRRQGVVPYLPLSELARPRAAARRNAAAAAATTAAASSSRAARGDTHETRYRGRRVARPRGGRRHRRLQLDLHGACRRGRRWWSGSATRSGWSTKPGLHFKAPFIDNVIYIDKRILDLENPSRQGNHRLRPEASGGRCLRALPHRRSAALLSGDRRTVRSARQFAIVDTAEFGAAPRARRILVPGSGARRARQS